MPTSEGPKNPKSGSAPREGRPAAPRRGAKSSDRKPSGPIVEVKRRSGVVEVLGRASEIPPPEGSSAPAEEPPSKAPATQPAADPVVTARQEPVVEEVPETESFAELFEASTRQEGGLGRRRFRVGEKVSGTIFQLGAETAFVSLGGKTEAMIDIGELKDETGALRSAVGDVVEAYVIEAGADGLVLSRGVPKGAASLPRLAEARASGMPVEGTVASVNKGGLEVMLGDLRAFCPISQIDVRFVDNPEQFVGQKLQFRVTEMRDRNIVLSRRALLEEAAAAKAVETRKELGVGKVLKGRVTSLREFGAFIDIGGVEGLLPVSEISHSRLQHPNEVLHVDDEVEVEVLRIEAPNPTSPDKGKRKERITLSMRSRLEDPWNAALRDFSEGQQVTGKVVRLQPFGAFVELRPGVDGLIHVSALSDRHVGHPKDVVAVGDSVTVVIEKIDAEAKRIGLRRVVEGEAQSAPATPAGQGAKPVVASAKPRVGEVVSGTVDRVEPYGVFVAFPGGRGLVPASETGTDRGSDLRRVFKLGQAVTSAIVDIDATGKIRLSIPAALRAEERADLEAWSQTEAGKSATGKSFGTLGDLLKGKLGPTK
jgi:small subunit ribosomal protein S1